MMTLAPGSFWAGAFAHPRSFDSRYFGPVSSDGVDQVFLRIL